MSALELYNIVNTAWSECRLENVLERQKELSELHANIKNSAPALIAALVQGHGTKEQMATEEVNRVLDVVRNLYDDLDFPASLANEQKLENGKSVPEDLIPIGPSLIDPDPTFPFASLLIPLAAAVSAGSAAVVLAPSPPNSSSASILSLIRKIVTESLDHETFAITADSSPETRQQLGSQYFAVSVLQNQEARESMVQCLTRANPSVRILAPPSGIPAVFVDRSMTNLEAVAAHIKAGILRGPCLDAFHVPRLCFVDEFIIDRLADLLNGSLNTEERPMGSTVTNKEDVETLQEILRDLFPSFRSGGSSGPVIRLSTQDPLTARNIKAIAEHLTARTREVVLVPITSLDDGIDLLNKVNNRDFAPAVYVFGDSKSSFYISKFTNALSVFINHLPTGSQAPQSPSSPGASFGRPYQRQDFSVGKSVLQVPLKQPYDTVLSSASHQINVRKISQPKGGSISYFEQGLLVGLVVIFVTISGLSYAGTRGARYYLK